MRPLVFALTVLFFAPLSQEQTNPPNQFSDPIALLEAVGRNYASAADGFRMESITDFELADELNHQWNRRYATAIKGPGSQYRIEIRTGFGSAIQVSDGTSEWVYQVESNSYVKRPLPPDWPQFPKVMDMMFADLSNAWRQRIFLEDEALGYKRATMLPEETILVDGQRYACYVVRANNDDSIRDHDKDFHEVVIYWIDKQALVFRKIRRSTESFMMVSRNLRLPSHSETTVLYSVAEIDPKTTAEMFRFVPPADAKEVATLEPDFGGAGPRSVHPAAGMVGTVAPEVSFAGGDGKKLELSSFRGKPLLIDFWATWCGPCLVSMPALSRIYAETRDKGLKVIAFDQSGAADDAPLYLKRHNYEWPNYYDEGKVVYKALKGSGIPLVVLIDSNGKILYYDFGTNEMELRKAIAGLGPQFASVASTR